MSVDSSKSVVMKRLLEDARKKLVETGTRNRLIHVNLENKRQNALAIINERSDDLFNILRVSSRKMRFRPLGDDSEVDPQDDTPLLTLDLPEEPFDVSRYTDNYIETPLNTDKLQKRLLRLARDAKTAEEEQGVNILYLALGFLTWYEDKKSAVKRTAPLILLPVSLERNARTSTYDIVCRDDDLVTNLPLQERLKEDFGIELPEIEESEEWTPSSYFELIKPVIEERENWAVCEDSMQLGFFSFAKLLMLRDLDPENWPADALIDNDLLKGVLLEGFDEDAPLFGDETSLDAVLEPADIIQVVDADASQTKVIEEVRSGRSLVVQGPPGTGKSQTITNIIAAAVHDGKSVLFVAEKMAALSVVHQRLVKTGLSAVCLELHSKSANKKKVLAELSATLNAGRAIPSMPAPPEDLRKQRNTLNNISEMLHRNVPERDFSAFSAMSKIIGLIGRDASPPELKIDSLASLSKSEIEEISTSLGEYCDTVEKYGNKTEHPFWGTNNLSMSPTELQRLKVKIETLQSQWSDLFDELKSVTTTTNLSEPENGTSLRGTINLLAKLDDAPPKTRDYLSTLSECDNLARLNDGLTVATEWKEEKSQAETHVRDDCWERSFSGHRSALAAGTTSFWARLGSKYRKASSALSEVMIGDLPKDALSRLEIVDKVLSAQKLRRTLDDEQPYLKSILGAEWRGERTPFKDLLDISIWFEPISTMLSTEQIVGLLEADQNYSEIAATLDAHLSASVEKLKDVLNLLRMDSSIVFKDENLNGINFSVVVGWINALVEGQHRYSEWVSLKTQTGQLEGYGLTDLLTRIDAAEIAPQDALAEFDYAVAEAQWTAAQEALPKLERLAHFPRQKLVDDYRTSEANRIEDTKTIVLARHLDRLPTGSVGEMQYIKGEIARKRGHKPIRKLIENAGSMVQRIKPVFLMSPISVAQFLPPATIDFDLLVIDEASQVRPEDALGAVVRAKQIVVVGDQKQLPPTSFFDRLTGNDETSEEDEELLGAAAKATDLESILSACEAKGLRSRMLEWHYRSRDPSLIRVSNAEFYDHNLVLPPSPLQEDADYGFKFRRVPGAYTSGSKGTGRPGTNKIEAQFVVDAIANHARNWSDLSLGIVAFSVRQRNMITELLEHTRRSDERLDDFLREGKREDVFVKNIENVQGDERDVIFISVGYGPTEPNGRLASMSFGPVNGEGGERRLNVLFSRSRVRCEVFASFDPSDIDLGRTTKDGPRVLRRFLDFAKTGLLDEKVPTGFIADSPFEVDVAEVVRKLGYKVDYQVGSGGFRVDLGVKHPDRPGQYMLAIECDGATYHSALWARERDRLRQGVLEGLGWNFHRIWSTDWFHRREAEIERLRAILEEAQERHADGVSVSGANEGYDPQNYSEADKPLNEKIDIPEIELAEIKAPPYQRSTVSVSTSMEPHEVPYSQLIPVALRIIADEGPIHGDEIAKRLATAFGKLRTGSRIQQTTEKVLTLIARSQDNDVSEASGFWFTEEQKENPPIRDRSKESGSLLKAEMLPPMEVLAAAARIEAESGNVPLDDLVQAVKTVLGYKKLGSDLRSIIFGILDPLNRQ